MHKHETCAIVNTLVHHSERMPSKYCHFNVDATPLHRIDVKTTLILTFVSAGNVSLNINKYAMAVHLKVLHAVRLFSKIACLSWLECHAVQNYILMLHHVRDLLK